MRLISHDSQTIIARFAHACETYRQVNAPVRKKKAAPKDGADYSDTMQDLVLYGWHSGEPGRN